MNSYSYRNDPIFLKNGFNSFGKYNFPIIKKQNVQIDNLSLLPYNLTKPNDKKNQNCGVHFFIDDYRFSDIFENPEKSFIRLCDYKFLLTPDASTYKEMPNWKIIENIGKSCWIGAYWQSKGKTVIPTLNWSGLSNLEDCISGIEKGCVVAVSTVGCRFSKLDFITCYNKAIQIINPPAIICLGIPFKEMEGNIIQIKYSRTSKISSEAKVFENLNLQKEDTFLLPFEEFKTQGGKVYAG